MSQGAYIEVANRAFDKVEAKVEYIDNKEWDHNNPSPWNSPTLTPKEYKYSLHLEMSSGFVHGHFRMTITINGKSENFNSRVFDLNDATSGTRKWSYYSSVIDDCLILITYGRGLDSLNGDKMEHKRGCYRFEIFRYSKRRIAVITDYHHGYTDDNHHDNKGPQTDVVEQINLLRNRPSFVVMPGDLLHNPTEHDGNDIWKDFINPLELKNIPVADGFGNHDLWEGAGAINVKGHVKDRNKDRQKAWKGAFGYDDSDNRKKNKNDGYHYSWEVILHKHIEGKKYEKRVVCIMLNNVPGKVNEDAPFDDKHPKGTWSYDSLNYLESRLSRLPRSYYNDEVIVLLFFHINYESERMDKDPSHYYRWWSQEARVAYDNVMGNYNLPNRAFFGHTHKEEMSSEILHLDKNKPTEWKGYLCAISIYERYLNVIDLELVEVDGKCKLKLSLSYGKTADLSSNDGGLKKYTDEYLGGEF